MCKLVIGLLLKMCKLFSGRDTISIETPGAFYILTDKFVIEIYFNAAPILFDNNSIIKFAPNISGIAKREDEIAEQEAEEERRRQQDDDDYYDDDY